MWSVAMSIEYVLEIDVDPDGVLDPILEYLRIELRDEALFQDETGLWIPSSNPKWIDFSIEKTVSGLFIVSNLDREREEHIFELIRKALSERGVNYTIEEV
jgi:hypothetical protein